MLLFKIISRNLSKYVSKDKSSRAIRQKFLDYFISENNHNFVKSSPVVPFCDSTVAFVNAGMNQFKGIFLGTQKPQHKKAANSQKCIRVGGKHNDLNVVGTDGYHHTFFEMLGNWSFGDYFKKEACELAWKLLTKEYRIHPARLYVTYFKGDKKLGLEEDLETKEIWKSLGVSEDRILPFTAKDNFWEMGPTGPCGPCTEIHVDHMTLTNRSSLVNKGLHDLTELWNLVFIQYNRKDDQKIDLLPERHVDTGMGFERLTAFLQGKISNYDTDNFTYLLKAIHKNCSNLPEYEGKFGESDWNNLDTSYRILADHVRMITICLADSMIPEQNQKLRRILRRSFILSENIFKKEKGLLKELTNYVIEHLGPIYPELERNVKEIHQIIDYEEEVYKTIREMATEEWKKMIKDSPELINLDVSESPNLIAAYREIRAANLKAIDGQLAFKLYDTHGLDEEVITNLAKVLNIPFDANGLRKELEIAKNRSKQTVKTSNISEQLQKTKTPKTDRANLYKYEKLGDRYEFPSEDVKILKIIKDNEFVENIGPEVFCSLILDKSNLYTEAGGQISDRAVLVCNDLVFEVTEAEEKNGYILHKGFLRSGNNRKLRVGGTASLKIDSDFRLKNMRNHTGVHLLNSVLKQLKGATCQKSSKVTQNFLNLDVGIFGEKLTVEEVDHIEKTIKQLIHERVPVNVLEVDSQKLTSYDYITLLPGEVYPENGIRIVEISSEGLLSREPCCGTHVLNVSDLGNFCVISVKSLGRSTTSIYAVTGNRADLAKTNGVEILSNIQILARTFKDNLDRPEVLNQAVAMFKQQLNYNVDDSNILPITVKQQCLNILQQVSKQVKEVDRHNVKQLVEVEIKNALDSNISKTKKNQNYLVHYLSSSQILENISLQKATRLCPDIPVLIISFSGNMVKARCCIPEVREQTPIYRIIIKDYPIKLAMISNSSHNCLKR